MALAVVVGPLRRALGPMAPPVEQPGERSVQPRPFARQEIGVHGFPGQGVPEGVRVPLAGHQQLPPDGLAQGRLQLLLGQAHGVPQQVVLDTPPGDGGGAQHLLSGVGQLLEADQQHIGEPTGHPAVPAPRGGEQLLGVEGVALGPLDDPPHRGVRQRPLAQRPYQPGHLAVGHRPQLQPLDTGQPHQLGEQRPQRMTSVQIVRAVGGEYGQPMCGRSSRRPLQDPAAEQEPQQVPGRLVGPVQILQDEQQGMGVGEVGEQPGDALEQSEPATGVPGGAAPQQPLHHRMGGEGRGEPLVLRERPEHLGERQVRQSDITEIDTVTGEHGHAASGSPAGHLVEEPRLADPGVPGDEHGPRLSTPSPLQHPGKPDELVFSPDEGRTDGDLRHAYILALRTAGRATRPGSDRPAPAHRRKVRAQSAGTRPSGPGAGCDCG
ncbi:hypothetical protein M2156_008096 [Streptomyces sp. SAI-149]|nr:hypothetical protein [Streptomyces sp. SAI-149]